MANLFTQHPIALDVQKYLIPDSAVIGDNVGKVNYLWSHPYFHNRKWGISVGASDYTFEIVSGNGDGTFAINSATGELTIANASYLSTNKSIVVRVKLYDWYYHDSTCNVLVRPDADCIYFDSSYLGGDSDGTRAKPYLKFTGSGLGNGTAGKTYLYKRGESYTGEEINLLNPKVGGNYPSYINFGAWDQGVRPYIDGTGGTTNRFMSVGTVPWGHAPINPADLCNNLRVFDIDTGQDTMTDWYPFLIKPNGDNIEFHRIKCSKTTFSDGLIYLPTNDYAGDPVRNISFVDVETLNAQERGFKIESGHVTVRNNYAENDISLTDTEIPCANAAHRPFVDIKYVVCKVPNVLASNLGLQIRTGYHNYQWCYLEGLAYPTVVFHHNAIEGVGGNYNIDSSSSFRDIIIKGAIQAGWFGRHEGTTAIANGVIWERIKLIDCAGGMEISQGATNTLLSYVDASDTDGWGIREYSGAGPNNRIENCTAMNTAGGDGGLKLDGPSATVYNTNYSGLSGTITGSNNSSSADIHVLKGAGIDKGYAFDLLGNLVPDTPSIGAVEASAIVEKKAGWPGMYNSGVGVQGGAGGAFVECKTWAELWAAMQADDANADNSPKTYIYTGSNITLSSPTRYVLTNLHNKTILGFYGQTITEGEIRFVDCSNILVRNWKRRGPNYPWGTGSGQAELDFFTYNSCFGMWFDHIDQDGEYQYSGAGDAYSDGCMDTNESDYIGVTHSRFWNTQRGMLIGYADNLAGNLGLLNTTIAYCWFQNIGGRQPKIRDGKLHLLNNLGGNDPLWADDWGALNKPTGQSYCQHSSFAQVYSERNKWKNGQSLFRDDNGGENTSGVLIVGDDIGTFQYTGGTVSVRPENVTWNPSTLPGYEYLLPLMTPGEAELYVREWAGATWHLKQDEIPTYENTTDVHPSGYGAVIESPAGPHMMGAEVTYTATPATGKRFVRWEEDEEEVSTANPYVFTVLGERSLTAVFVTVYENTVTADPDGYGTASQSPNEAHVNGAEVTLTAVPGAGKRFVRWSVEGDLFSTENPHSYFVSGYGFDFVAEFEDIPTYANTIAISPEGFGTASESPAGPHVNSTEVTLTATPGAGKRFVRWSVEGDLFSTENPHSYFVAGYGFDFVAEFEDIPTYANTVAISPLGFGTVSESPAGPHVIGTETSLTATPEAGKRFVRWEEDSVEVSTANPYAFTVSGARELTAVFETIPTYANTIAISPEGFGTASESPAGPHVNSTEVTLTATPGAGKRFVRWSVEGDLFSTENPHSYFVAGYGFDFVAEFEDIPATTYALTTAVNNSGWGSATDETNTGPYESNEIVNLQASAADGYYFVKWTVGGLEVSDDLNFAFTMPAQVTIVTAVFAEKKTLSLIVSPNGSGTLSGAGNYAPGEVASLEATPAIGWSFSYWMVGGQVVSYQAAFNYSMPGLASSPADAELLAFFEATAPSGMSGLYTLNGINMADYGIFPSNAPGSNIAISGAWDLPSRMGKTHHSWPDQDGVEPYVREDEIFHEGRTILFHGLVQAEDFDGAIGKVIDFYEVIDSDQNIMTLNSLYGSWNVHVQEEITAKEINGGWWEILLPFREPEPVLAGTIPVGDSEDIGLDGVPWSDWGLIPLRMVPELSRPSAKEAQLTVYGKEGYGRKKRGLREYSVRYLLQDTTYTSFKNRLNALLAVFKSPGLRTLRHTDGTYREVFCIKGFQVTDVHIHPGQVTAVVTVQYAEVRLHRYPDLLTDNEGQLLTDNEGNALGKIYWRLLVDNEGLLLTDNEGRPLFEKY